LYKIISIGFFSIILACCNTNKKESKEKDLLFADTVSTNKKIFRKDSIPSKIDTVNMLPIYGEINRENLSRYFPGVTDTIKDLRVIGSEKIELNPGNGILVSILHNTGTFDQMIVCTHDQNLNLIDNFYVGKATQFDKTSRTIEYKIIDEKSMRFDQVNWGYVKKGEEYEIDTVKYESYIITINAQGQIKKNKNSSVMPRAGTSNGNKD
jgi:hypothetical protein